MTIFKKGPSGQIRSPYRAIIFMQKRSFGYWVIINLWKLGISLIIQSLMNLLITPTNIFYHSITKIKLKAKV